MRIRTIPVLAFCFLLSLAAACSGGGSRSIPATPRAGALQPAAPALRPRDGAALVSNGGRLHSFSDAVGMDLRTDADYAAFVDPQVTGADRALVIRYMRMMPPGMRGDLTYIGEGGRILSNRISVRDGVLVKKAPQVRGQMSADAPAGAAHPMSYPPTGGGGGPYIRNYSAEGVTAGYAYATIPCETLLDSSDHGDMYFNNYTASSGGSVVDGGIEVYPGNVGHPFLNVMRQYIYSGWTNEQQTYPCGTDSTGHAKQAVGIMFGSLYATNTVVLAIGIPDYSPYQYSLPPQQAKWSSASWIFYPTAPAGLFTGGGLWNNIPSPCMTCSVARMFTIAQTFPNSPSLACFGACNGYITGRWDQTVMGELIQPCSQVQGQSETCTIEYTTNGSWYGSENDSGQGIFFNEANDNDGFEGINLQNVNQPHTALQDDGSFGPLQPIPTPTPAPLPSITPIPRTSPPTTCGPRPCW